MEIEAIIDWFEKNRNEFSEEMNGYKDIPVNSYLSTLPLINRDGKIIDLGCGNGMLLRFLMEFSGHSLIPHGIDIKKEAIDVLISRIIPEYNGNFSVCDVNEYDFPGGPYDLIIGNPAYTGTKGLEFTNRCIDNLNPGGKLILRMHNDIIRRYDEGKIKPHYRDLNLDISEGANIRFCTYDKK